MAEEWQTVGAVLHLDATLARALDQIVEELNLGRLRVAEIDGGQEAIRVATAAGITHFVYVSVAHPAPAMHAYIAARTACEALARAGSDAFATSIPVSTCPPSERR